MVPLSAMTATANRPSFWMASIYAGIFTAVAAVIMILLFAANVTFLWPLAGLLMGLGPILGRNMAAGNIVGERRTLIVGLIGFILFLAGYTPFFLGIAALGLPVIILVAALLSAIIWPIVVGAMDSSQSIGKLLLGSIIGAILGDLVTLFIVANVMGQDPTWVSAGFVIAMSIWGGAVGAFMAGWSKEVSS